MTTDHKKFHEIWVMNEEEAKEMVHKVLEVNRVIHEHQLGLEYFPPADMYACCFFYSFPLPPLP